jgi:DNA-binding NarL/FixJ family response regulator
MNPSAQIVLLSSDPARAAAWRSQIDAQSRHQVAAVGQSATEAMALVTQIDPDAVVCELKLHDGRAIDLVRALRRGSRNAGTMILIIAPSADHAELLECLRHGADSYYVDNGPGPTLDGRIFEMLQGEAKMSPEIARNVLDHFRREGPSPHGGRRSMEEMLNPLLMSALERVILMRLSQGQSVPEIATAERLSMHQIAKCIRGLYRKMAWDLRAGGLALELA